MVGNEKVMVVTNALDDYWFKYDEEDEKRIKRENGVKGFNIGFSGRYEEYKRWDVVLEICNALKKYPDIQFTVAITADEAYRDEMKKFVSDLKRLLRKKLKLFIDMPKENMGSFYYMLDIFVLTSRNESFGRVLIEAMTKNNIVLGTDSGGVPADHQESPHQLCLDRNLYLCHQSCTVFDEPVCPSAEHRHLFFCHCGEPGIQKEIFVVSSIGRCSCPVPQKCHFAVAYVPDRQCPAGEALGLLVYSSGHFGLAGVLRVVAQHCSLGSNAVWRQKLHLYGRAGHAEFHSCYPADLCLLHLCFI